jgi:hypothetical protein
MTLYAPPICLGCHYFRGFQQVSEAEANAYDTLKHGSLTGYCAAYEGKAAGQTDAIPAHHLAGLQGPSQGGERRQGHPLRAQDGRGRALRRVDL